MSHNLRECASHFLIKAIGDYINKYAKHMEVSDIPTNTETYLSINLGNIVFIDSYQITPDKISNHVANLPRTAFNLTKEMYGKLSWPIQLGSCKGVYPYE